MKAKRFFDIVVASLGLIVAAPLMLLIAIIIKIESKGPVLYPCVRIGRFGKTFSMLKFRTMVDAADNIDCKLCAEADVRVTAFGALLRRTKLNELPQLFNVVAGHMSLVGPRPEDPKFVNHYKDRWDIALSVRPGIAGPNQILHRNEEDLFPGGVDREAYYLEHILPEKLDRDIQYVRNYTLWTDVLLLTRAVLATAFSGGLVSRMLGNRELLTHLLADVSFSVLAFLIAHIIRFETIILDRYTAWAIVMTAAVTLILFPLLGVYRRSVRFFAIADLLLLVKASLLSVMILTVGNVFFLHGQGFSRVILFLYPFTLTAFLVSARVIRRRSLEKSELKRNSGGPASNVLIYGAGRVGAETLQRLKFEPGVKVLGFVDDDPIMRNRSIEGVKVMGDGSDLPFLKSLYEIDQVFIAFTPPNPKNLDQARRRCLEAGLANVLITSGIQPIADNGVTVRRHFRGIRFSDVLGIPEVCLDDESVRQMVGGTAVAVVGAGDQLGEHICRELFRLDVAKLVVVEESQERLSRIDDAIDYINTKSIPFAGYCLPFGFHEDTEVVLKCNNVKWIIYNRPVGPAAAVPLNENVLFLTEFLQTMRFVDMAKRLECLGFIFLSPHPKGCLSAWEQALHLLSENYVRAAAGAGENGTRLATMRMQNIVENEVEIFRKYYRRALHDISAYVPGHPMRFSSARYAARNVLNGLTLENRGETFIESSGSFFSLGRLVDFYSQLEGKGSNGVLNWPIVSKEIDIVGPDQENSGKYVRTTFPYVLMLPKPEIPDLTEIRRLAVASRQHLTAHDTLILQSFFSVLHNKHLEHSNLYMTASQDLMRNMKC